MILLLLTLMIGGQKTQKPQKPVPPPSVGTSICKSVTSDKPAVRNVDKSGKCPAGETPLYGPQKTVMSCLGKEHPQTVCTPNPAK